LDSEAMLVRRDEPVRDLLRPLQSARTWERSGLQAGAQRLAVEQLTDEVWHAVVHADIVEGDDVRVIDGRGGARLALEARPPGGVGANGVGQDLDGDVASEADVVGTVDGAHAAGPDEAADLVRPEHGSRREPVCQPRHASISIARSSRQRSQRSFVRGSRGSRRECARAVPRVGERRDCALSIARRISAGESATGTE
jgi:hypothetical protein